MDEVLRQHALGLQEFACYNVIDRAIGSRPTCASPANFVNACGAWKGNICDPCKNILIIGRGWHLPTTLDYSVQQYPNLHKCIKDEVSVKFVLPLPHVCGKGCNGDDNYKAGLHTTTTTTTI